MKTWTSALLASAAIMPAAAMAQSANDDASGDIIVTAQRYEQRLQDVPLSVSVVGAKELAARSLTDLKDLQYSVPGLSSFEYGVSRQFIQLRGISTTLGSSTVGLYLDETPLALDVQGDAFNIRLLDMQRVEVLRGPQATLYGQGSMGGTIRYIPADPKLDSVSGSAEVEYSDTKGGQTSYKAIGVVNLPLSTDKVGLRLVGGYERIGGFIDNVPSGEKNVNETSILTLRANLLAKPSDRLTLGLLGLYQKSKQDAQDFGVGYKSTALTPIPANDRYTIIQGKAAYDLDAVQLSVSGHYIDRRNYTAFDLSSFYVPVLPLLGIPAGFIDRIGYPATTNYKIWGGEVRLASQSEGPFGWQVGATYRKLHINQDSLTNTSPGTLPFAILDYENDLTNKSYALFAEANYAFTSQLKATVGVRYFNERKNQLIDSTSFGANSVDIGKDTFDSVNPRFNVSYDFTPNSMLFVNVAKGFRSGGFNTQSAGGGVIPIPPTYDPDEIWTYEVGTKHQLFGNKLVIDASVYRSEWSKVQSYAFAPGSAITITTNAGEVSGWGVDLGLTARPTSALTLSGTYSWNNLEFDKATGDKIKGDPVDGAVRKAWSASADFRPPLTDSITGIFRIDYQHAAASQITLRNFGAVPIVVRPGRDLVNLRAGAAFGPIEVTVFANNLFDENAPLIVGPFGVIGENVEQRPRVIGVSAKTAF